MKRRSGLADRRKPHRNPGKTVLIVCEGKKTEPNYFHEIRKSRRLSSLTIEIVPGDISGTHPKSIIGYAKELRAKRKKDGLEFEKTWCVFDRDDHEKIHEAFDQAKANNILVAFSNPCFELWFLLHFRYHSAHIHRDNLMPLLKGHFPNYDKNMEGFMKYFQAE